MDSDGNLYGGDEDAIVTAHPHRARRPRPHSCFLQNQVSSQAPELKFIDALTEPKTKHKSGHDMRYGGQHTHAEEMPSSPLWCMCPTPFFPPTPCVSGDAAGGGESVGAAGCGVRGLPVHGAGCATAPGLLVLVLGLPHGHGDLWQGRRLREDAAGLVCPHRRPPGTEVPLSLIFFFFCDWFFAHPLPHPSSRSMDELEADERPLRGSGRRGGRAKGGSGTWDQFRTNEDKFGVRSTYELRLTFLLWLLF